MNTTTTTQANTAPPAKAWTTLEEEVSWVMKTLRFDEMTARRHVAQRRAIVRRLENPTLRIEL